MTRNLVAELIRIGVRPQDVTKTIAEALGVSEKTARNKVNGHSEWTVPEAMAINQKLFHCKQRIEYLFATTPDDPAA